MKTNPSSLFAPVFRVLPVFAAFTTGMAPLACASAAHDAPGSDAGAQKAPAVTDGDAASDTSLALPDAAGAFPTDAADSATLDDSPAAEASPDAGADATADVLEAATAILSVNGAIIDINGFPAPGLTVNVVDGSGASHVAVSDGAGTFTMTNVVTPYALTVAPPPGSASPPASYLGVTTATPTVVAWFYAQQGVASFNLSIAVPSCGTATCPVTVTVTAPSTTLFEETAYAAPGTTLDVVGMVNIAGMDSRGALVTALVSDSVYSRYWYAQAGGSLTPAGPAVALGTLTPTPIPNATTLTLTSTSSGPIASWPVTQQIIIQYPAGGGNVRLGAANSSVVSCAIPDILGATIEASSAANEADGGAGALAAVTGLPLTTTTQTLAIAAPPTWLLPSAAGQAISSSGTLSWQPSGPDTLSLVFLTSPNQTWSAYVATSAASIALTDLAKMGVVPPVGPYDIEVIQTAPASLDALLQSGTLLQALSEEGNGTSSLSYSASSLTLTP
jgi:hypothetical protein